MKRNSRVRPASQSSSHRKPYILDYRNEADKMEDSSPDVVTRERGRPAVNFLPSRQMEYNTMRLRRSKSEHLALLEECAGGAGGAGGAAEGGALERRAALIVRGLEQHTHLMEDNLEAEELRREALRELPQGLTLKRSVRAKLSASVSLRSERRRRPIPLARRLKYRLAFAFRRFGERSRNLVFSVGLWYEAIREVEAHFGSAVGSYFNFLRWLFVVNLALTVFLVSFVVAPQIVHDRASQHANNETVNVSFRAIDLISGKGALEQTLLFYGSYTAGAIRTAAHYHMSYAYFFTCFFLYITCFVVLCYRTASSYRRNFIEPMDGGAGGAGVVFAARVFCGWDFGIGTSRAAALNARSLYNEFKELLNEQNRSKEPSGFLCKCKEYSVNAGVWALVLALGGAAQLGLWRLLQLRGAASPAGAADEAMALAVAAGLTAVLVLGPLAFGLIVKLEYYSERVSVYVTLSRALLLHVSTLLLLFVFWARHSHQVPCWETTVGQEIYRLVLFDAVFSLFLIPLVEFFRGFIFNARGCAASAEFGIAYNSLSLTYNQALVWAGFAFAPPLAALVALKLLVLFYVKKAVVMRACQPARKVWRAAQTQTVFYMLVNLSLFVTLLALGSLLLRSEPACGPFRDFGRVYELVTVGALALPERPTLRTLLSAVTRPGVIAFLMLFLAVWVYYTRARARAQRSMVQILRQMLVLEAKDKDFLLAAIAKVSNGEWQYSRREASGPDGGGTDEPNDSYTWHYLRGKHVRTPANADFQLDARRAHPRPQPASPPASPSADGDSDDSFSWRGPGERRWL